MAAPVSYPTNYQLSHQVSGYMRRHFCSLAFPDSGTAAPQIPLNLPVNLSRWDAPDGSHFGYHI